MLTPEDLEAIRIIIDGELEARGLNRLPKDAAQRQREYRERVKLTALQAAHNVSLRPITKHNGHDREAHNENVTPHNKTSRRKAPFVFPEWLAADRDVWDAWVEARTRAKHPPTDWAKNLAVAKLEHMKEQGHSVRRLLAEAAFHNWQSFYVTKD